MKTWNYIKLICGIIAITLAMILFVIMFMFSLWRFLDWQTDLIFVGLMFGSVNIGARLCYSYSASKKVK